LSHTAAIGCVEAVAGLRLSGGSTFNIPAHARAAAAALIAVLSLLRRLTLDDADGDYD